MGEPGAAGAALRAAARGASPRGAHGQRDAVATEQGQGHEAGLVDAQRGILGARGVEHAGFQIGTHQQVEKDRGKERVGEPARERVERALKRSHHAGMRRV